MNCKIDTIIFDLGGVLVDWNPKYLYEKIFDTQEEVKWFLNNVCTSDWNIEQDGGRTIEEANSLKIAEFPEYEDEIKLFYNRWEEMFTGAIEKS
ncbi:MAG: 2-haloacid dehalogenase, partial [Roseivirga sp.]